MAAQIKITELGWWMPENHWQLQKLWKITGNWQIVRGADGTLRQACQLLGREGWWDGNYTQIVGVTHWFKPAKWFVSEEDTEGNSVAWHAHLASQSKSPFR